MTEIMEIRMSSEVASEVKPVEAEYPEIFFDVGRHESEPRNGEWSGNQAHSCCAVLELGDINDDTNYAPLGLDCVCKNNVPPSYGYTTSPGGYSRWGITQEAKKCAHPKREKKDTSDEELKKAFKKFETEAKKGFGMIVVYLLPKQDKGWIGRLVRDMEWEDLGKFYNPKTRHTLHHYRKVLRTTPPRRSRRKVKRVFG